MAKTFFEVSFIGCCPTVQEVVYPHCPTGYEYKSTFLVYAENKDIAWKLALAHRYEGYPMGKFFGRYKGECYDNISCIM